MLTLTKRYPKKRAFITGAASGLGAALCRQLAADGWTIGMCDVRPEALAESVQAIKTAGGTPLSYTLDVTDREAYAKVVDTFLSAAGGVDLVVNNAGVAGGGAVGEFSLDDWEWLLKINLLGPVYGCHFFAPHLREQRSGHIINIASAAALVPVPKMAAYCTAKAGVKMLSEVLSNELKSVGVDVSVVMPEFFRTNLHERTRGAEQAMARKMITGAKYSADDVANTVLRDAGKRELYITFPRHTQLIWWLLRLSPELGNRVIRSGEKIERKRQGASAT